MSTRTIPAAKFKLDHIVSTLNALSRLTNEEILRAIQRHHAGDWGDVGEHDRAANDQALIDGTRILSVYHTSNGTKFWLITEAGRPTMVLLPEDY